MAYVVEPLWSAGQPPAGARPDKQLQSQGKVRTLATRPAKSPVSRVFHRRKRRIKQIRLPATTLKSLEKTLSAKKISASR